MINDNFPPEQLLTRQLFPYAYSEIVIVEKAKNLEQHVLKEQGKS
jgi:hypothetical protein